jgi:hypothetical protein
MEPELLTAEIGQKRQFLVKMNHILLYNFSSMTGRATILVPN